MEFNLLTLCYLIASVTFILGLKMLSNPASARKGNLLAAFGKNEKANLSQQERNLLAKSVKELVASWRKNHGKNIH